jgi:hypothetical protein
MGWRVGGLPGSGLRQDEDRHQSLSQSSELGPSSPSVLDVVDAHGSPQTVSIQP